jgi:hypothetical protein
LLNGHDLTGWYSMLEKSGKDIAQFRKIVVMEQDMLHILGNELLLDLESGGIGVHLVHGGSVAENQRRVLPRGCVEGGQFDYTPR